MPEKIITILENIAAVKGQDYVDGLVDMANILIPTLKDNPESECVVQLENKPEH